MQLSRRFALSVAAVALLWAAPADAYPQFQFSTGATRCSLCHYSPTGGGLINPFGRSSSADTISQTAGNPDLMHGLYKEPDWFRWSADLRYAAIEKTGDNPDFLSFPMQGDYYQLVQFGKSFSWYTAIGPRAGARSEERQSFPTRLTAKELSFKWQPKSRGWYVRAGRFMAPFGTRSQNHTDYVRRYNGFHSFEETLNLNVGRIDNKNEFHATAFMAIPYGLLGNGQRGAGAVGYYEVRPGKGRTTALAGQAKVRIGDVDKNYILGGVAKHWLEGPEILLMGELDVGLQQFDIPGESPARAQLLGYFGATYFPFQGLMVSAVLEHYDPDVSIKDTQTEGASVVIQYFPRSHHELVLLSKTELVGGFSDPKTFAMFQYHYWL